MHVQPNLHLLPCPFPSCRSALVLMHETLSKIGPWFVRCEACGASGPGRHQREDAAAAWNDLGQMIPASTVEKVADALVAMQDWRDRTVARGRYVSPGERVLALEAQLAQERDKTAALEEQVLLVQQENFELHPENVE